MSRRHENDMSFLLLLQYRSCRLQDCIRVYGEGSVSEELDDFTKEFRAAAVDKNASDLTSLVLLNGQPDRGSTKISGQGHEVVPQKESS